MGFEPTIAADERPYTYTLDRAATGTGYGSYIHKNTPKIFHRTNIQTESMKYDDIHKDFNVIRSVRFIVHLDVVESGDR